MGRRWVKSGVIFGMVSLYTSRCQRKVIPLRTRRDKWKCIRESYHAWDFSCQRRSFKIWETLENPNLVREDRDSTNLYMNAHKYLYTFQIPPLICGLMYMSMGHIRPIWQERSINGIRIRDRRCLSRNSDVNLTDAGNYFQPNALQASDDGWWPNDGGAGTMWLILIPIAPLLLTRRIGLG